MLRRQLQPVAFLLLTTIIAGCSRSTLPKLVRVKGVVTYQGKPLDHGEITFEVVEPAAGFPFRPANARIESDGSYTLSSFAKDDGVVPGEYRVRIICYQGNQSFETPESRIVWAIPKRYGNSETSKLTASVSPDETNVLVKNFELTD